LDWHHKHEPFSLARKTGKDYFNTGRVEKHGLLKRALGYQFTEETRELMPVYKDGEITGYEMMLTKTVTKDVAPDPTSIFFYLQNRAKQDYQPVGKIVNINKETHIKGEVTHQHKQEEIKDNLSELSVDELRIFENVVSKAIRDRPVGSEEAFSREESSRVH